MTWASVTIPLVYHENRPREWKSQARCYPHQDLVEVLERIAGPGDHGLWWTEDEADRALQYAYSKGWVWVPCGPLDLEIDEYFSNRQTHMKIFFKNPAHAVLFKLTWV